MEMLDDDCSVTGHRSQLVACQRTERERDGGESHLWSMNVSRFQVIDRGFAPTCSYVGSLAKRGAQAHSCLLRFPPVRLSARPSLLVHHFFIAPETPNGRRPPLVAFCIQLLSVPQIRIQNKV